MSVFLFYKAHSGMLRRKSESNVTARSGKFAEYYGRDAGIRPQRGIYPRFSAFFVGYTVSP